MTAERETRLRAGRAIARDLADPEKRAHFRDNGYESGQQILTVLEDDLVGDVFDRARSFPPPVLVAIYSPEKNALEYMEIGPGDPRDCESPEDHDGIGGTTTIGMVAMYVRKQRNGRFTSRITQGMKTELERLTLFV